MSVPGGVDLLADLGVDLNFNSSSPLDVSSRGSRSACRSAKFDLIFTTRCQFQEDRSDGRSRGRLLNFNSSSPLDVSSSRNRSASRSAKFELIFTT